MEDSALRAGVAAADITPPVGIPMGGYWGRHSGATGVHDGLAARVITFRCGSQRAALITLDLVGLGAKTVSNMRESIANATPVPAENVMVCCSHTHAGPLTVPFRGMGKMDPGYLSSLQDKVLRTVMLATQAEQPAHLAYARVPARLGVNRREDTAHGTRIGQNWKGPVAHYAHVVRVDGRAGLRAVLFSHACHGVVLGSRNHLISADWPGAAARHIEAVVGAIPLFVNGACGDVNPRCTNAGFAQVEQLGIELGTAILDGVENADPLQAEDLRCAAVTIALPLCDPPSRLRAEVTAQAARLRREIRRLTTRDSNPWQRLIPAARAAWAEDMLAWVRAGSSRPSTQAFHVQAIRVGDLVLLGLEGEMFVRYQLELEQDAPARPTLVCGYANGCIGYVPTADEYERGGYEVEEAYRVYPTVQMIAPESEQLILRAARKVLAEVTER